MKPGTHRSFLATATAVSGVAGHPWVGAVQGGRTRLILFGTGWRAATTNSESAAAQVGVSNTTVYVID